MSLKVLLADDSMTAQNMGRKILSESGYDVTTVSNGAAAVKKIAEVKPDLVILDIYMPGYTGLEVCERVRSNFDTANLPVLLTVGKMEPYRAEDGAKVRADGVIVKPFEATDLLAVVKKMAEKVSSAPTKTAVREEQEETEEESFQQPESPAAAQVEVPSELAVAPALGIDEFDTGSAAAAAPAMQWSVPEELPVEQAAPAETSQQFASEVPWAFNQHAEIEEHAPEAMQVEASPAAEVEFNSAPKVGNIEVQQAADLEPTHSETVEVESAQESALASAQEITDFATTFTAAPPTESHAEQPAAVEAPAGETSWNGWAHADPTPVEEHKPNGVIDDFEAKVAAAMTGFGTEPVEPATAETHGEATSEPVDDFEARVAAAMSGFATEPVGAVELPVASTPAPAEKSHSDVVPATESADDFEARVAAAMSGFSTAEPSVQEPVAHVEEVPAQSAPSAEPESGEMVSGDDFDARLAEAMASFDTAPEASQAAVKPQDETQEIEPSFEPKPAINLNETTVLPQEAVLSLEEEMKKAMEQEVPVPEETVVPEPPSAPETISWEPPKPAAQEEAPAPSAKEHEPETVAAEALGDFDSAQVAQEVEAAWKEEAVQQEPAAATPSNNNGLGGEKLADAVHRAIDRLKPQLIAEIVKELKGE